MVGRHGHELIGDSDDGIDLVFFGLLQVLLELFFAHFGVADLGF